MGFDVLGTFRGAAGQMLAGVSDICLRVVDGVVQVFTATRAGGGVLALELQAGGDGLALIDQQGIAAGQVLSAPGRLSLATVAGQRVLVWTGGWAADPGGWALADSGRLDGRVVLSGGPSGVIAAQVFATVGASSLAILAPAGDGVLEVWGIGAGGRLVLRHSLAFGSAGQGFDVAALETLRIGGATFVLSLSAGEDALAVHRLRADGTLATVSTIGAAAGLGLATPSALEVVQAGGRSWVLVAGAGSSSVSVLELMADGRLALTDHVIDTLDTRFQAVSALATAVVGDRVFVFAAGGDAGVQAFVLLPDGRLVAAGQQLMQVGLPLDDITALDAVVRGGRIELILGTENGGLIRLRFDPGDLAPEQRGGPADNLLRGDARGDLLAGMAGDDTLIGGGGDDILFDSSGADVLWGGPGADTFVLAGDGDTDEIRDFEPGHDRIDLSGWGRIYTVEALPMAGRRGVVVVRWEKEVLYIHTADGRDLDPGHFASDDFFGLWHLLLPSVEPGGTIAGSPGRDTLAGEGGDDTLLGSAGADRMQGGGGFDLVDYGMARRPLRADLAQPQGNRGLAAGDRYHGIEGLAGGSGADSLTGDGADNRLLGRGGGDLLLGGGGDDLLDGGAGADRLAGGAGADTLRGGAGADTASYAGAGQAVILALDQPTAGRGGAAGDVLAGIEHLTGSRFADRLQGDAGANALQGRAGDDRLAGGRGNDTLIGGAGSDWALFDGRAGVRVDLARPGPQQTGQGRDRLAGIENLLSGTGDDRLFGTAGANYLHSGAGRDLLDGRGGADRLLGGAGNDRLIGGGGFDIALYHGARAVRVDLTLTGAQQTGQGRDSLRGIEGLEGGRAADRLAGNAADNRLLGAGGADRLLGRGGHDSLTGGAGADRLLGGEGRDLLLGGAGHDRLDGGAGGDILRGGAGSDSLLGGSGADRFIFDGGRDRLLDHDAAEGDRILLDSAVLRGLRGMTGAAVVARWGSDLGADVALDFGSKGFLLIEDMASLAALGRAVEVI